MGWFDSSVPFSGDMQGVINQLLAGGQGAMNYGQFLQQPLQTGVLPTGAAQLVENAYQSQLAGDRSKFAQLGLANSTMEQSAEAQAGNQKLENQFKIEEVLARLGLDFTKTGIGAEGQALGGYEDIAKMQITQDDALLAAIAQFGGAVGGAAVGKGGIFGGGSAPA